MADFQIAIGATASREQQRSLLSAGYLLAGHQWGPHAPTAVEHHRRTRCGARRALRSLQHVASSSSAPCQASAAHNDRTTAESRVATQNVVVLRSHCTEQARGAARVFAGGLPHRGACSCARPAVKRCCDVWCSAKSGSRSSRALVTALLLLSANGKRLASALPQTIEVMESDRRLTNGSDVIPHSYPLSPLFSHMNPVASLF